MNLADAHMHLFPRGYHRPDLPSLFGEREAAAYEALRIAHGVELALAIGYQADGLDPENNACLRRLARSRNWLRTLAYVGTAPPPQPAALEALLDAGHAGLAIYALDATHAASLLQWPPACWRLLQSRGAIVSFNARPQSIAALAPLAAEWPGVAFLFSHLGLPGVFEPDAAPAAVRERLRPLLGLAGLPNVHVKMSGAYATSRPPHAYPHRGACDALRWILDAFGPARCLWGSDFAPALDFVSFAQTLDWPPVSELQEAERRLVLHDNLARMLAA
jgi:predicted TIM-barrel fold metal-dependent hydrolase